MRMSIQLLVITLLLCVSALSLAQSDCVYIAGTYTDNNGKSYVAYWKSGQLTKLTNASMGADAMTIGATSIEVIGNDVHVAGYKTSADGKNRKAAYWKNGRELPICFEEGYYWSEKSEAVVKKAGNDVYVFVTQPSPKNNEERGFYYYYYKNSVLQKLKINQDNLKLWNYPYNNNEAKLTFVTSNGDIYYAVRLTSKIDNRAYVTYWKNGEIVYNKNNKSYTRVDLITPTAIYVTDNGDVYIAGSKAKGNDLYNYTVACWKNGYEVEIPYDYSDTHTQASGIYLEGNNVYITGLEWINSHPSAVYWKNGQKNYLNKYDVKIARDAVTYAIAAVNGNVYTAGGVSTDNGYWVNNKLVKLNDELDSRFPVSMTVVKGGGCFNNTMSSGSTTAQDGTTQSFNSNVIQGQANLSRGDYTGAMQSYANAATTATTKSEQQLATGGVIISGLAGLADAWQKSAEEKRKREVEHQKEKALAEAMATEELENNWKLAKEYAAQKTIAGYKKAIELMLGYANADKLNGMALNTLGTWYGGMKDVVNAMKWYKNASYKDNADAYYNLGIMARDGEGVKANQVLALYYFEQGCKKGSNNACTKFKNTREVVQKEIEDSLNSKRTAFKAKRVGDTYRDEKNYKEAKKYYQKSVAADSNFHRSYTELAKMYFDTSQLNNYDSAAVWYTKTVNSIERDLSVQKYIGTKNGFDNSYTNMLFNYAYSVAKINNGKLAIEIYLKAVRDGDTGAYTQVGVIYELGLGGIEKDWKLAAEYYEKDADKNSAKAMYYLGKLYEKGGPNLDASARLSKKWYKKACEKDQEYCKK